MCKGRDGFRALPAADDVLELRFKKFVFSGDKKEMLQ